MRRKLATHGARAARRLSDVISPYTRLCLQIVINLVKEYLGKLRGVSVIHLATTTDWPALLFSSTAIVYGNLI